MELNYEISNFWGQQESAWIAFYLFPRYFLKEIEYGKENDDLLNTWADYAQSCNWIWVFKDICFISDRPKKIHKKGIVLHNLKGKAVEYRDGWGIYVVDGINMPDWVIEFPESITLEKINAETNMEVQRIMIDFYGVDRYLKDIDADIVHRDNLGLEGSSDRLLLRDKTGKQWMVCTDGSTGRMYHISVPSEVKTCPEAHKTLCGFDESRIIVEA